MAEQRPGYAGKKRDCHEHRSLELFPDPELISTGPPRSEPSVGHQSDP